MDEEEMKFYEIVEKLTEENPAIEQGKMMSSPGLTYRNKVFAFYSKKEMVFKLGKGFDPQSMGVEDYQFLNPFKNKPPMKGWFRIPFGEHQHWEKLAKQAFLVMSQ